MAGKIFLINLNILSDDERTKCVSRVTINIFITISACSQKINLFLFFFSIYILGKQHHTTHKLLREFDISSK